MQSYKDNGNCLWACVLMTYQFMFFLFFKYIARVTEFDNKVLLNQSIKNSQAGFDPPPVDDTSYEADALLTKPPWLDVLKISIISISFAQFRRLSRLSRLVPTY